MRLNTYEMRDSLETFHSGGHAELLEIAKEYLVAGENDGLFVTSREDVSNGPLKLPISVVKPTVLAERAPWLEKWYRGPLLEMARDFAGPLVVASEIDAGAPLINVHRGWNPELGAGESYECHVDSNYPTGLYFLGESDRTPESGGALAVSNRGDVPNRDAVLEDCERYYPKVGELAIMNGYQTTHFVEPTTDGQDRIMLVCNFWTPDIPEATWPTGIDKYNLGMK